ncbi:MAG: hypothetical protein JRI86_13945 [Deltaproteobacteria bacterium]|nr:hypothetical protein [Deltaproteobacteria bacterium]
MRLFRFFVYEFLLRGILFAIIGTMGLVSLYFLSIGVPFEKYAEACYSFFLLLTGSTDFSMANPGYSASAIIMSGAGITLPLAIISLVILVLIALSCAAISTTTEYLEKKHGNKILPKFLIFGKYISILLAAIPLFVGFWVFGESYGNNAPFLLIAFITITLGGLGWDASRFLLTDMQRQMGTTHTMVFSTLGLPLGRLFPLPGTLSGYLLSSSFPRFIPYLAGKVPAIIGGVTIAEIIFSFPGLGSTLLDALLTRNTDLLIASVFILLCVNAIVTFAVKTVLFFLYPRLYEKAI